MIRSAAACLVAFSLFFPPALEAGSGRNHHYTHSHASQHHSTYITGVKRDKRGRIARSSAAKSAFKKEHPCPSTGISRGACPGHVIDHVVPLKRGGADRPGNMQWQTHAVAKEKDRWE